MHKISISLFIFVFVLFNQTAAQKCLSLAEFKNVKQSVTLMKQYIMETAYKLTNAEIPQMLGQRIKYLAQGSFGKVYKYMSPKSREIAVKFIQKNKMENQRLTFDYPALFLEINANSCMVELINMQPEFSSKFVLLKGVYYVTDTDEFLMVMNYYPLDLDKFQMANLNTNYNYASQEQAKMIDNIVLSMAKALQFMHTNDLSHRDLKPANVMMNGSNPMFMDFGLTTPEASKFSTVAGTPYFIDPKLLAKGSGGKETDIYALGIMYYVLFNGPSSYRNLDVMMKNGNWDNKHAAYDPNITMLKFPKKYAQLATMLNTSGKRPDIDEVVNMIELIQGKAQQPMADERHLYGGQNMMPKPKYEQEARVHKRVAAQQADQMVNKYGYIEKGKIDPALLRPKHQDAYQPKQHQNYQDAKYQMNRDEGLQYEVVQRHQAEAMKLKAQINQKDAHQVDYQPIRRKVVNQQKITPAQRQPQQLSEAQMELIRVQKLAAQNKAKHLKDNGIFLI